MGSVGKPLPNVEFKLAEDGELLTRGPSVFTGYWQKPAANAECFDAEGWFRTGDIAHLDADGFLSITDRKKELLKTSGGKLVAPQPIENKLKNNVLVGQAALVGDKHKFISALHLAQFCGARSMGQAARASNCKSRADLVADSRVVALYGEIVREVNSGLANFETLKRFRVVARGVDAGVGRADAFNEAQAARDYGSICGGDRRSLRGRSNRTRRIDRATSSVEFSNN